MSKALHYIKKMRPKSLGLLLIIVGLGGLLISGILYMRQPKPPKLQAGTTVDVATAPSSIRPSKAAIASYSVAPSLPKYIALPSIGVSNTRVMQLGLLSNGAIATPNNIYDTGWYNGSSKPGQAGAMFIYGHVSSWTADGIFYNLKKLKAGDKISITRGDNQIFTYQVVTTKIYPYNAVPMDQVLAPITAGVQGLNLMTCTGQVIKGTSEFNERLVVYTNLVKS